MHILRTPALPRRHLRNGRQHRLILMHSTCPHLCSAVLRRNEVAVMNDVVLFASYSSSFFGPTLTAPALSLFFCYMHLWRLLDCSSRYTNAAITYVPFGAPVSDRAWRRRGSLATQARATAGTLHTGSSTTTTSSRHEPKQAVALVGTRSLFPYRLFPRWDVRDHAHSKRGSCAAFLRYVSDLARLSTG